ncbi:MAG: hypothetical protein A2V88_02085 [Elusimicrobia bacterium RBG_16_66_12]|nr:MAG: hypothetical protein A2V88_02085 [Elusimicrobia bacterium RBG_16_66_12]
MKTLIKVTGLLVACLVIAAKLHAASVPGTPIAGSKHDFTVSYNGQALSAVNQCSPCHEMHKPLKMKPLWARADLDAAGWVVKKGALDGTNAKLISPADFVASKSGLCLSCHEGSMAINNGVTMAAGIRGNMGRDLSQNHSIGYERGATSGTDPVTGLPLPVDAEILKTHDSVLQADGVTTKYYIGCTSCHSLHGTMNQKLVRNAVLVPTGPVCLNCHTTK